jgi:hypothetical protein
LFIAAWANLSTVIFDVKSAFFEGRADCEQFCRLPLCASDGNTPQRVKIVGNLYGEKQAPKVWNDKLNDVLGMHACICTQKKISLFFCLYMLMTVILYLPMK